MRLSKFVETIPPTLAKTAKPVVVRPKAHIGRCSAHGPAVNFFWWFWRIG